MGVKKRHKYYPKSFSGRVKNVINRADVILELVDARNVQGTRIKEVEDLVRRWNKDLIIVINKIDLANPDLTELQSEGLKYCLISSKQRIGKKNLMRRLKELAKRKDKRLVVGVVGYPDVGKSSLINYLSGKKKTRVEFTPGSTKGEQYIRLSDRVMLIDTPGVYRRKENQKDLTLKFAYSPDRLKDPVPIAIEIIERYLQDNDSSFLYYYGIVNTSQVMKEDAITIMEIIGKKRGLLMKGGEVNLTEVAKLIIRDYQRGNLPPITK